MQEKKIPVYKQPWFWVVAVILAYFIIDTASDGSISMFVENRILSRQSAEVGSGSGTWSAVRTFTGDSIKNTESFTVSDEWRIKWDTQPGEYGDMNFVIVVYDTDDNLIGVAANVIGADADESYFYDSGTYYLAINSAQEYTITVEDKG